MPPFRLHEYGSEYGFKALPVASIALSALNRGRAHGSERAPTSGCLKGTHLSLKATISVGHTKVKSAG